MEAIIFEDINDKFGYGEYLGFKVIIMKENGYINASKMLKAISQEIGKERKMNKWKSLEHSPELIEEVEKKIQEGGWQYCHPGQKAIIKLMNSNKEEIKIQGQYVHPDLIVHIASWASPKIAIRVSTIVNEYIINKYKIELEKQKKELEKQNKKVEVRDRFLKIMNEIIYIAKTSNTDEYYASRVSKRNRCKAIKFCNENGFEKVAEIKIAKNSVAVFNKLTTLLKVNNKIKRNGNYIKLIDMNINDFIDEINKITSGF